MARGWNEMTEKFRRCFTLMIRTSTIALRFFAYRRLNRRSFGTGQSLDAQSRVAHFSVAMKAKPLAKSRTTPSIYIYLCVTNVLPRQQVDVISSLVLGSVKPALRQSESHVNDRGALFEVSLQRASRVALTSSGRQFHRSRCPGNDDEKELSRGACCLR